MNRKYFLGITLKDMIIISFFTVLMIVGAFIKIPLSYVPITLQPFFCALAGIFLGSKKASLSMVIYIILGLAGLPVFAYGGGLQYVLNPTFGFIIGFVAAAFIIGAITEKGCLSVKKTVSALIAGLVAINIIGIIYFSIISEIYIDLDGGKYLWGIFFPYFVKDLFLYSIIGIMTPTVMPRIKSALYT